MLIRYLI